MSKSCEWCGKTLEQRIGESNVTFERRKYCGRKCAGLRNSDIKQVTKKTTRGNFYGYYP